MKIYFAPLEGVSGYVFRNAHHAYFPGVDRYYAPFISTSSNGFHKRKEVRDILPEHNKGIPLVPQLLSNHAGDFIHYAKQIRALGYEEVNLNLGCPSKTVVTKKKGSGFLKDPETLAGFLDEVFSGLDMEVSVKTRIGLEDPEEWEALLSVYNQFPVKELIVHPRTQKDYYKHPVRMEAFAFAMEQSRHPICYNGDICTKQDYERICQQFPNLSAVMIGRGFLKNPALVRELTGGAGLDVTTLRAYHDRLYKDYRELFFGDKPVLFKMKEFWMYLLEGHPRLSSCWKKIKKTQRLAEYDGIVYEVFDKLGSFLEEAPDKTDFVER